MAITTFTDEYISPTAGSIKQINFAQGGNFKSLKHYVDELDEESLVYKYTLIEAEALVYKLTNTYYTVGDFMLKEDEVKAGKEKVIGMYKAVEAYILQNPQPYA
ncbi:major allergen Pru ar 1-like [Dorcoceras hygrometricum]|uniref:Major allergen Pru ar 1-like n=1 Tax=Dorcoceras hygrometricum TaxID=472368 RepID=A0A2Z7CVB7_9LAMI|nr:major allergen Pru ar 1-like [Dorcoceras hygrometricum]